MHPVYELLLHLPDHRNGWLVPLDTSVHRVLLPRWGRLSQDFRIIVAYQASVVDNDVNSLAAQVEEVSELAFFTWEEIPELAFPIDKQILVDWKKLNGSAIVF